MKKFICLVLFALLLLIPITACENTEELPALTDITVGNPDKDYSHLEGTTLYVFNWGEYISDGSDNSLDINAEFERLTGIHVEYSMYDTNESMYSKLSGGGTNYDIVIPSDYMIQRMIGEDMLEKLDFSNIPNYKNIAENYKNLYFDATNEFSVPYMVGMVGLIYNKNVVTETPTSWNILWDEQYSGKILMINNSRDAFAIAQLILGQDLNTENPADWNAAAEKLKEQKPIVQSYVMDEVFDKMESGEAALVPYYGGDFLTMLENNPDLALVYPDEGTNIFVDSVCIPKGAQNKEAAELYINFLLEPEVALANAETVCYPSPNTTVLENPEYDYKDNEYLYPDEAFMPKVQYFHNLSAETLNLVNSLWDEMKIEADEGSNSYLWYAVGIGGVVLVIVGAVIISKIVRKKRDEE